jgi:hypothetical protein
VSTSSAERHFSKSILVETAWASSALMRVMGGRPCL